MKTIKFSDDTELCSLGQGTWNMGRNPLKRKQETEALLTGIELGMTMIDTAEMYANEAFVGKAIDGIRDKVFLVSKVLPENASVDGTIRACENSLRKL
ncbi:MAG: aldo/keto reductase, partial [Bacteroides sp.]|nr:aldo/keto reductase [Bacteroides sp.]